jgi:guanylate kinase
VIISRRGTPLVISAPSGAGKTTLCHRVIQRMASLVFSVSHTTRAPRGQEVEGKDYHFISDAQFDELVAADAFLEWAHVHGKRYGTTRAQAERHLKAGTDVLFDIDVQGGRQISEAIEDAVLILIMPPSMTVLAERLRNRHTDTAEAINRRLGAAAQEMIAAASYTHFIVNDNLDEATIALESVVRAERLKRVAKAALLKQITGISLP